jgi:hypothetical protein
MHEKMVCRVNSHRSFCRRNRNATAPQEALLLQTLLDRDFGMGGLQTQLLSILQSNLGWVFAGWCGSDGGARRCFGAGRGGRGLWLM